MAKGLLGAALLAACLAAALRGAAAKGQHDFVLPQQHQQEQQQEQAQAARAGKHDFVMQQPGQEQKEQTQPEYASKHDFVMPGQEQEKKAQAAPEPQQPRAHAARTHADAALWRWLNDNGAALNYVPAVSEFGLRGGIALNDIQAGGLVRRSAARSGWAPCTAGLLVGAEWWKMGMAEYGCSRCATSGGRERAPASAQTPMLAAPRRRRAAQAGGRAAARLTRSPCGPMRGARPCATRAPMRAMRAPMQVASIPMRLAMYFPAKYESFAVSRRPRAPGPAAFCNQWRARRLARAPLPATDRLGPAAAATDAPSTAHARARIRARAGPGGAAGARGAQGGQPLPAVPRLPGGAL